MLVINETEDEDLADTPLESHLPVAWKILHKLHKIMTVHRGSLKSPIQRGSSPILTSPKDAGLVKVDNLSISWNHDKESALLRHINFEVNRVSIYVFCILHLQHHVYVLMSLLVTSVIYTNVISINTLMIDLSHKSPNKGYSFNNLVQYYKRYRS